MISSFQPFGLPTPGTPQGWGEQKEYDNESVKESELDRIYSNSVHQVAFSEPPKRVIPFSFFGPNPS